MAFRIPTSLLAALALSACVATPPVSPPALSTEGSRTAYEKGMVSAADARAAEAGAEMLRAGGSATDAAIATMLALTVVEPQSSGIGGGGFMVLARPDGGIETLDGRETAPAGATPDWFLDQAGKPRPFRPTVLSGLSVGVPGNMALAAQAHRQHGKLPWARLFGPAVRLAREGWTLSERFHEFLVRSADSARLDPAGAALFFDAAGAPLPVGTTLRNRELADTLDRLAKGGADAFYTGKPAADLSAKVRAATPRTGGMTPADLAAYRARPRDPVCGTYRLYRICGMGPPSSGATTVLAILGTLERFDLAGMDAKSAGFWHLFAEAQRLAYADRERYLADADFVAVPVAGLVDHAYLQDRGKLLAADRTMGAVRAGTPAGAPGLAASGVGPSENGTSHFVAIDRAGETVTYTSTIESGFGSGLMTGGFYLNNELTDFSFVPEQGGLAVANRVEGGKRPRSSMAPTLVYAPDGTLMLAIGAAGGATIPVQVSRVLIGVIDWKLPIAEALALPVLFSPGDTVTVEAGTPLEALIPQLKALGHAQVVARALPIKTNAIAVVRLSGAAPVLAGAADPRSEGRAVSE